LPLANRSRKSSETNDETTQDPTVHNNS